MQYDALSFDEQALVDKLGFDFPVRPQYENPYKNTDVQKKEMEDDIFQKLKQEEMIKDHITKQLVKQLDERIPPVANPPNKCTHEQLPFWADNQMLLFMVVVLSLICMMQWYNCNTLEQMLLSHRLGAPVNMQPGQPPVNQLPVNTPVNRQVV